MTIADLLRLYVVNRMIRHFSTQQFIVVEPTHFFNFYTFEEMYEYTKLVQLPNAHRAEEYGYEHEITHV
jgi:hypothetical protein